MHSSIVISCTHTSRNTNKPTGEHEIPKDEILSTIANYSHFYRNKNTKSLANEHASRLEILRLCDDKFARETKGQFTF